MSRPETAPPYSVLEAEAALARADGRLGAFIARHRGLHGEGGPDVRPEEPFPALVRSIVYQQLSGKAAGTIHGRLLAALAQAGPEGSEGGEASGPGGSPPPARPEALLALSDEALRACGLSRAKTLAVRDLAARAADGRLPSREVLLALPDDEVVRLLTAIRGVGPWTAEMVLLFNLGRPDVWPVTDLGVQEGFRLLRGLPARPSPAELRKGGATFGPWRSVAAWYLWRLVDAVRERGPEVIFPG